MLTSRVVPDRLGRIALRGLPLVLGLVLLAAPRAAGEERVALVIGNAAYTHSLPLANPVHDATAVGAALRRMGFDVTEVVDADMRTMVDALAAFQGRSASADKAVVFYAGHGIEVGGQNYLVPVDAELARERDVSWQAVPLNQVLDDTKGARLRLVILDACRNNPFLQQAATRTVARGLARVVVPPASAADEMLVALSTAPGSVAEDGEGQNSPFTEALLEHLEAPDVDVGVLFRRVTQTVLESTGQRQRPWVNSSLLGEHYLVESLAGAAAGDAGAATAPAAGTPVSASAASLDPGLERVFWESIRDSGEPADFEDYLSRWPDGTYARLAHRRLEQLAADGLATEAGDAGRPPAGGRDPGDPVFEDQASRFQARLGRDVSATASDENGWTDLHHAAALNLPALAGQLLDQRAFVDATLYIDGEPVSDRLKETLPEFEWGPDGFRRRGETPLHVAAASNAAEAVEVLLARGANVNASTTSGATPLHVAASRGRTNAVHELLTAGADLNARDAQGATALHAAAKSGHVDVVRELASRGANMEARDEDGDTPLHVAASQGRVEALRELAMRRGDVNARNESGATPLHEAAWQGHIGAMRELMGRGADMMARRTDNGQASLDLAARRGHVEIIRELLRRGADVHSTDTAEDATPLHQAAIGGQVEAIRALVDSGADVMARTRNLWTPLHEAARHGHVPAMGELVDQGADVRALTDSGQTALHAAALGGSVEAIRDLANRGLDEDQRDRNDRTPLQLAARGGHVDAIRELVRRGADVRRRDRNNETPLHEAARGGHVEAIRTLAEYDGDVRRRDRNNETPLHEAARAGHTGAVRELARRGADVKRRNRQDQTPLHMAARGGHVETVRELVDSGSELERKDNQDRTPLHWAAAGSHLDVVRELISRGADVTVRDDDNLTPRDLAQTESLRRALGAR